MANLNPITDGLTYTDEYLQQQRDQTSQEFFLNQLDPIKQYLNNIENNTKATKNVKSDTTFTSKSTSKPKPKEQRDFEFETPVVKKKEKRLEKFIEDADKYLSKSIFSFAKGITSPLKGLINFRDKLKSTFGLDEEQQEKKKQAKTYIDTPTNEITNKYENVSSAINQSVDRSFINNETITQPSIMNQILSPPFTMPNINMPEKDSDIGMKKFPFSGMPTERQLLGVDPGAAYIVQHLGGKKKGMGQEEDEKGGLFQNLLQMLGLGAGAGAGLFSKLGKVLKVAGPIIGGVWAAVDAIKGVGKAQEWGTSKAAAGIGGAIGGTDKGLSGALKGAGKGAAIGSFAGPIGTLVGGAIGAIAGAIGGERIAKGAQALGENIKQKWELTKMGLTNLWENTKETAKKSWEGIKNVAKGAWEGIKNFAGKAWDGIKGFFGNVGEGVKNIWNNLKNNVKNGLEKAKQKINETSVNTLDKIQQSPAINKLFNAFIPGSQHLMKMKDKLKQKDLSVEQKQKKKEQALKELGIEVSAEPMNKEKEMLIQNDITGKVKKIPEPKQGFDDKNMRIRKIEKKQDIEQEREFQQQQQNQVLNGLRSIVEAIKGQKMEVTAPPQNMLDQLTGGNKALNTALKFSPGAMMLSGIPATKQSQ